jgi:hypothetical protein
MKIEQGRVYRAKKPGLAGGCYVNDRQVLRITEFVVQYDGPSVRHGSHFPSVPRDVFEKWADRDVTDELPKGDWMDYHDFMRAKRVPTGDTTANPSPE